MRLICISALLVITCVSTSFAAPDPLYGKNKILNLSVVGFDFLEGYKGFISTKRNSAKTQFLQYYHNRNDKIVTSRPEGWRSSTDPNKPYYYYSSWLINNLTKPDGMVIFEIYGKKLIKIKSSKFDENVGGIVYLVVRTNLFSSATAMIPMYLKYDSKTDSYTNYLILNNGEYAKVNTAAIDIETTFGAPHGVERIIFDGKYEYEY